MAAAMASFTLNDTITKSESADVFMLLGAGIIVLSGLYRERVRHRLLAANTPALPPEGCDR